MDAKGHADQRPWAVRESILFRVQFNSLHVVSGQQAVAKGAHLSPSDPLRQKQPQVTTAPTSLQIGRHILTSQHPGQLAQALPGLGVISIEDDETGSAFLVKKICAQGYFTLQMGKQVAHVEGFVDADVAAVINLAGVQVPTLDETLGQHQGWAGEFCVWDQQAFALYHRITSIARLGGAQQAEAQLRAIITPGRSAANGKAGPPTQAAAAATCR